MTTDSSSVVNIALIGGGEYCRDVLQQTTVDFLQDQVNSTIVAVAEPDDLAPGAALARRQGLDVVSDFRNFTIPNTMFTCSSFSIPILGCCIKS
jgi:two-component system NtrC family sensor kinase